MLYHHLTWGPKLVKSSKCSKRWNAQIANPKMEINKMHKNETPQNQEKNIPVQRGRTRVYKIDYPVYSPRHLNQYHWKPTILIKPKQTEGRTRVNILHLLSCESPRHEKQIKKIRKIKSIKNKRGENDGITLHLLSCEISPTRNCYLP